MNIQHKQSQGKVVSAVGVVVDVYFSETPPAKYSALETTIDDHEVVLEVQMHLGEGVVRTVSMSGTDGIQIGQLVTDTGAPIQTPVGEDVLGRVLNVLGDAIDNGEAFGSNVVR